MKSTITNPDAQQLIDRFGLKMHPEGGYYARNYLSQHYVKSVDDKRYGGEKRSSGSSIYYMLTGDDFSAWHCLQSDEIWHYYKGSPVQLYVIGLDGVLKKLLLGPVEVEGATYQVVLHAGEWFAAENLNLLDYSFVGCTVSPGFDFKDFKLADRAELIKKYPQHLDLIKRLTREQH